MSLVRWTDFFSSRVHEVLLFKSCLRCCMDTKRWCSMEWVSVDFKTKNELQRHLSCHERVYDTISFITRLCWGACIYCVESINQTKRTIQTAEPTKERMNVCIQSGMRPTIYCTNPSFFDLSFKEIRCKRAMNNAIFPPDVFYRNKHEKISFRTR